MLPISACVIAFNEETKLAECLDSVAFCAEVIVVDSHSTDRTREIAVQRGAKVIERDWPGHIEQKNFAIEQATHDWVLCIDADERVLPELREAIEREFAEGPRADGYGLNRRNVYLGRWIRHGGWYPDRKLRLFKRAKGRWGGVNPHDHVGLDAGCVEGRLPGDLQHLSYDGIADHLRTIDYFSTIAAKEKLSRGQRGVTLQVLFNPPWKFTKMFVLQRGFLDGWRGLIVAMLGAIYVFLRYAKLWELIHVQGQTPGSGAPVTYGRRGETAG
ncbi:MAG: glycosyltransferase family 2 protein [Planctomycetes bacterium]|nr:glycosyltransferase family 2 protein [Planctomycetota bacterium]